MDNEQGLLSHSLLSSNDTLTLLRRVKAGDREAADLLVRHNYKLIVKVALNYFQSGMCGDQTDEDLIQYGAMGLLKAAL